MRHLRTSRQGIFLSANAAATPIVYAEQDQVETERENIMWILFLVENDGNVFCFSVQLGGDLTYLKDSVIRESMVI